MNTIICVDPQGLQRLQGDKIPGSYLELKNPKPGGGQEPVQAYCPGGATASWPVHFSSTAHTPTSRLGNVAGCTLSLLEKVPKPQTLPRTHVTISWTNRKRSTSKPRTIKKKRRRQQTNYSYPLWNCTGLSPGLLFQKFCCLSLAY